MTEQTPAPQQFNIDLPPENIAGHYADFASVWHTANSFVMDFVVLAQPPTPTTNPETGQAQVNVPGRVVSRVRIAPEQVFELAKALTIQLEAWELETGRKKPDKPIFDVGL